jgi:ABC-type branched-subunit amino acid transport system ATPase component
MMVERIVIRGDGEQAATEPTEPHLPPWQREPLLQLSAVTRRFGGLAAVDGVDLALGPGTLLCLIGPNGCGKTTLFNLITGELAPTFGEIRFDGSRIDGLRPFEVARRGLLRKFQIPGVYADLSVAENLRIASHSRRLRGESAFSRPAAGERGASPFSRPAGEGGPQGRMRAAPQSGAEVADAAPALSRGPSSTCRDLLPPDGGRRDIADGLETPATPAARPAAAAAPAPPPLTPAQLLDLVRLSHRRGVLASELPHGERQWLEIAMVVAAGPRLMLLDEPTTGMTAAETRATVALARDLHAETGVAAIVIEHDMAFVAELAAPCAFMLRGRIAIEGSFEEVRAAPLVRDAYLGAAV